MSDYPRTGICIWCGHLIEDAREHSGWTRPEPDWAAPFKIDGRTHYDWGCEDSPLNDDEGTGGHVDMSDLRRNWQLYEVAPKLLEAAKEFVADIEAAGVGETIDDWPDLVPTYHRALAAIAQAEEVTA